MARRRYPRRPLSPRKAVMSVVVALSVSAAYAVLPPALLPGTTGEAQVHDGDTLRFGKHRMRLFGIDAPELAQHCTDANGKDYACGEAAQQFLNQFTKTGPIICQPVDDDRYNRDVALCFQNGQDLNRALVLNGWAVAYADYSPRYLPEQLLAMWHKRGIWAGKFETPSEWRAARK